MKFFGKVLAVASLFCAVPLAFSCSSANTTSLSGTNLAIHSKDYVANKDIVVLYTNDVHCGYEANTKKNTMGYTNLVAYRNSVLNKTPNVTLVDCGDAIQGEAIGTISKGKYIVDLMNEAGYDLAILGNHEFDYSIPRLQELMSLSKAKYLGANLKYEGTKSNKLSALKPYEIVTYGDIKVAFIGVTTPASLTSSTPKYFMEDDGDKIVYTFDSGEALYKTVQKYVDEVRALGAKHVVVLAHLGIEEDVKPNRSYDLIHNTTGIDVLLDGHSHSTIEYELVQNKDKKNVVYSQTGTKLSRIGELTITPAGKISTRLVTYSATDPAMNEFVSKIKGEFGSMMNTVVAKNQIELSVNVKKGDKSFRAVRNRETTIGNFCADAYRAISGADIAFVNGGGIRADIPAGNITNKNIIDVHPYGNYLCMVETKGQKILDALELGAMNTARNADDGQNPIGESGGFLQVSGLKYTINTSVPTSVQKDEQGFFVGVTGKRRVSDVEVIDQRTGKWVPLDPKKDYKLASHNYKLQNMGDGYNMFVNDKFLLDKTMLDNQVLITYIRDYLDNTIPASKYAKTEGRITIK